MVIVAFSSYCYGMHKIIYIIVFEGPKKKDIDINVGAGWRTECSKAGHRVTLAIA